MTTRAHEGKADLIIATIVLIGLVIALALKHPEPMPARAFTGAPPIAIMHRGVEVARYIEIDRRLEVTEHAPRDLLVCFKDDCRLVEQWLGR
jgi:hypothetical protein